MATEPETAIDSLAHAAAAFAGARRRLFGLAYRMLGSVAKAEDLLQEAWLRWQACDRSVVLDPAVFLSLTKSAVLGMTRGLAYDLGPLGISVNAVEPGPTATDMVPGEGPMADYLKGLIPLGRLAHADEIADFVSYLASGSSFIHGAGLTIDGGMTA